MFEAMDDPYLAARGADVQDVADRLRRNLLGGDAPRLDHPSIVVAPDLTPSQTASLDRTRILGLATDAGSVTSHTAILARALGIPAVVGLGDLTGRVQTGDELGLDGESGAVVVQPTGEQKALLVTRAAALRQDRLRLESLRDLPAETVDGRRITLAANIGSPEDIDAALDVGAEGVGLFRTEFLFAGRPQAPTEDEQVTAYRAVLARMAPHFVVIRTLDIGGDKPLPYLPPESETNPILGQRGVRYTLAHDDVFRTQLRALLRASGAGNLGIMLPMVGAPDQIETVREMLSELQAEVGGAAQLGIMVEVPAAALLAGTLARRAAFFSVGTNDLVQYTLAVDRTNEQVGALYQPLHPAVLRLLHMTVEGAHVAGKWAGVCGEMAGDSLAVPLLVGLGFDELSMTPARVPAVKEMIRELSAGACRDLVNRALQCESAGEVERLVREVAPVRDRRR
jgi:phosphotransferase system enzyme I (PtsI)